MTKVGEHITLDIIGTTKEYDPCLLYTSDAADD